MKTITYVVGNPATGKSNYINTYKDFFVKPNTHIHDVSLHHNYSEASMCVDDMHENAVKKAIAELLPAITKEMNILVETTYTGFLKSLQHLRKFKNRGYFVEVYFLPINLEKELKRNSQRLYPTPEYKFIEDYKYVDPYISKYTKDVDYIQFIDNVDKSPLEQLYFFKSSSCKHIYESQQIQNNDPIHIDHNAIHFCCSIKEAKTYGEFVYRVNPIGEVFKYGNIFYAKGVEFLYLADPMFSE